MSEWIPVEQELPKNSDWVLVFIPGDKNIDSMMASGFYDHKYKNWEVPEYEPCWVSHWMPLPHPPEC